MWWCDSSIILSNDEQEDVGMVFPHHFYKLGIPSLIVVHLSVSVLTFYMLTTPDACRSLNQLRDCLQDVSLWMKNSKLKLNANKTEFIIIGTVMQRAKLDGFFLTHILNQSVTPAPSVSNLGVNFDESFNFK